MELRRASLIPIAGAGLVLLHHAAWFRAFPQYSAYPPDQAGYLAGGQAIFSGVASLARDGMKATVVEELRRWFDFLGVGIVYGAIDALRPHDLAFARAVLALFNSLTAIGVYSLARRLSSPAGGVFALAFFVVSPAFPSGASRLYTDAITGCLIVWGVRLFVEGGRRATVAGLLVGAAMLIRVQLLPWVPLGLAAGSLAALLLRVGSGPREAMKRGWLGLSVPLVLFAGLTYFGLENRNPSAPKHNLPRYQYYAYGFWQYVTSDGWEGPWRLKKDPFYAALLEESRSDPGLLESRPRQYVFAARYIAARFDTAIPIVFWNFYRIFDRPQNPEHRGFIDPDVSVWIHRLGLLCAVVAAVHLQATGSTGFLAPVFVLALGAFHALAWGWPRYAMPVLPLLLALSGIGLDLLLASVRARWRSWGGACVAVLAILGISILLRDEAPELAWILWITAVIGAVFGWVVLPFRGGGTDAARAPSLLFGLGLSVVVLGSAGHNRVWHEREIPLRRGDVVRQEIRLSPQAIAQLRASQERYVGVDLELRVFHRQPWRARVNGLDAELLSSIPPLPESIPVAEEARAFPQWWLTALTGAMLERIGTDGLLVVELQVDEPSAARLKADRFRDQQAVFEAPSLGDWPYAAGVKPEYDRDFRLTRRMPLSSEGTRTSLVRSGASAALSPVARIRVFTLDDRDGRLLFDAKRAGSEREASVQHKEAILAFAGRAVLRNRGEATLSISGERLLGFQIAPFRSVMWTEGAFRLCYRDRTPDRSQFYESRGLYLLAGPISCAGGSCPVEVRFRPGIDDRPMSFTIEPARSQPPLAVLQQAAHECGFDGKVRWMFDRVTDGTQNSYPEDRGRWRVDRVY